MRRHSFLILLSFLLSNAPTVSAGAQEKFDSATYLHSAIEVIKAHALNSSLVDWVSVEREAINREKNAADVIDTFDTVNWLLVQLGDHHSFPQFGSDRVVIYKTRYGTTPWPTPVEPKIVSTFGNRDAPSWSLIYRGRKKPLLNLIVPMRRTADQATLDGYARTLFDGIIRNGPKACGYIVDLRGNTGGNEWPMIVGLSPLLGEGNLSGTWSPRDGQLWFRHSKGGIYYKPEGEIYRFSGWRDIRSYLKAPVAVLIDDSTASSGIGTAISFKGRKNTRFFGIKTGRTSTSNAGFELSDGTNLVITTSVMTDRYGRRYKDGVSPHVVVDPTGATRTKPDKTLGAAKAWLSSRVPC